ncbi:MAG: hypothetical protein AB3N09_11465 [Tateyamaria sp.]
MMRVGLFLVTVLAVAACSSERRPDIPVQTGLPPIGLASQAVWLQERQQRVPRQIRAAEIPTEDICDIVDDCTVLTGPAAK